jgi:hypothetical protein
MTRLGLLATLLLGAVGANLATALEIQGARLSAQQFDPAKGEVVEVRFALSEPARARVIWWDGADREVRATDASESAQRGEWLAIWDGTDTRGRPVPPEAYHYTIEAEADGTTTRLDVTDSTGGENATISDIAWDSKAGVIRYRLSAMARVNIRIGFVDYGPLLATVIDWVPRSAGEHAEPWDGRDQSKVLELSNHPSLQVAVDAFELPANTLIVGTAQPRISLIEDLPRDALRRERQAVLRKRMHQHSQQPLEARGDIAVSVALGGEYPANAEGTAQVGGIVPVRLDVSPVDRQRALERRFEPVFFVDGTFAFENEVGFLPTTWLWNTAGIAPGTHYITVNLRGYEGNFGMATLRVEVLPEAQPSQETP